MDLKKRIWFKYVNLTIFFSFLAIACYGIFFKIYDLNLIYISGAELILLLVSRKLFSNIDSGSREFSSYASGIDGEDVAEAELMKLPDSYHVFHNIFNDPAYGDIDFVVVGPTGIFSIEVKNDLQHINIHTLHAIKEYINQSLGEAVGLKMRLLKDLPNIPFVNSMLVLSNKDSTLRPDYIQLKNLNIMHLRSLNNHIKMNKEHFLVTERLLNILYGLLNKS